MESVKDEDVPWSVIFALFVSEVLSPNRACFMSSCTFLESEFRQESPRSPSCCDNCDSSHSSSLEVLLRQGTTDTYSSEDGSASGSGQARAYGSGICNVVTGMGTNASMSLICHSRRPGELQLGHSVAMDLVRPVGDAQDARPRVELGEDRVAGQAARAVSLHGAGSRGGEVIPRESP